ncbi:MAG: hypothetical protein ACOX3R_13915 [Desulfitobacteriia bacterium]
MSLGNDLLSRERWHIFLDLRLLVIAVTPALALGLAAYFYRPV